jgi:hypothetical protein
LSSIAGDAQSSDVVNANGCFGALHRCGNGVVQLRGEIGSHGQHEGLNESTSRPGRWELSECLTNPRRDRGTDARARSGPAVMTPVNATVQKAIVRGCHEAGTITIVL